MTQELFGVMFTAHRQAELVELEPYPLYLQPDEIEGRTVASLISTGMELAIYGGDQFPCEIGYASVVEVERTGENIRDILPGDHVLCMAPHLSSQRVERPGVVKLPRGLDPYAATFARLMAVSMTTLTTTTARPPGCVAITGLGLIGHLAAQIFRACGYSVFAADPLERRRDWLAEKGVSPLFHSLPLDAPEYADRVDLILECSGSERAALDACRMVRPGGEVVLIGIPWKRKTDLYAHEILDAVFHRYVHLRGGWEWELPVPPTEFTQGSVLGNLEGALRWLAEGRVSVDGLYRKVSPNTAQEVYQSLLEGTSTSLGCVFDWAALRPLKA